jgi:hypothetical protein
MANLSTYYPAPITAADLGLGAGSNATFGSIQNTPIGSTTASSGSFTTLTANNGTLTGASAPVLDLAQTWNNAAVTFTGLRFNVTNTASAAASKPFDFQIGGTSVLETNAVGLTVARRLGASTFANAFEVRRESSLIFSVRDDGAISGANGMNANSAGACAIHPAFGVMLSSNLPVVWSNSATTAFTSTDLFLRRDAAGVLAQYNGTNAQTFNIYNTFTSATNHERGFLKWSSNVFQIGTEAGSGGGTARTVEFPSTTNFTGQFRVGVGTGNASLRRGDGVTFLTANYNTSFSFLAPQFIIGADGTGGPVHFFCAGNGIWEQRNTTNAQTFRIYNTFTSATNFERLNLRWASNELIIDAEAGSGGGTLRGIKIGSATSSLLGFYGATPVDQPATVADPAGGGTIDTEARTAVNDIIDRLQELGLIA